MKVVKGALTLYISEGRIEITKYRCNRVTASRVHDYVVKEMRFLPLRAKKIDHRQDIDQDRHISY